MNNCNYVNSAYLLKLNLRTFTIIHTNHPQEESNYVKSFSNLFIGKYFAFIKRLVIKINHIFNRILMMRNMVGED